MDISCISSSCITAGQRTYSRTTEDSGNRGRLSNISAYICDNCRIMERPACFITMKRWLIGRFIFRWNASVHWSSITRDGHVLLRAREYMKPISLIGPEINGCRVRALGGQDFRFRWCFFVAFLGSVNNTFLHHCKGGTITHKSTNLSKPHCEFRNKIDKSLLSMHHYLHCVGSVGMSLQ